MRLQDLPRAGAAAICGFFALVPALLAQQTVVRGSFIATRGSRDTVAIERFMRTAERLEAQLLAPRLPWQTYRLEVSQGGQVHSFDLSTRPAFSRSDAAPIEVRQLRFSGDSVSETRNRSEQRTQRQRYSGVNAVPLLYPSLALMELATRRARLLGGDAPVQIPFIEVGYGERQFVATLSWISTDSARLDLGGNEFRLAVDVEGGVLGGRAIRQDIVIQRQDRWVDMTAPDYTAPPDAPYTAEDVRVVTSGNHWLVGTLTRPKATTGRVPVAIAIPGSGQLDRDGAPEGLSGYQPFREMAEALAARGVALLRYDKRGVGGSSPGEESTSEANAEDVRAALRLLRARADIAPDRIALIGHSEGAIIAPMVAASDSGIRAVALLAGPAWTGREVLRWQIRADLPLTATGGEAQRDSVATQRLARLDAAAAPGSWMRFYLDYDPLPTLRKVRAPVLILQGTTDQNVATEQAELLASTLREAGNTHVTVQLLTGVNHFLLDDPNRLPSRDLYRLPSRRINGEALRQIGSWVAERLR